MKIEFHTDNVSKVEYNPEQTCCGKFAYASGKQMIPFGIFLSKVQQDKGVTPVLKLTGFGGREETLVKRISDYWSEQVGIEDLSVKWLLIDYFLTLGACYVELPKFTTKEGMSTPTFDKFIATKNIDVIARWLGLDYETADIKYGTKIRSFEHLSQTEGKIYAIKLTIKDGNPTVSVPRTLTIIDSMNVAPLFMLSEFTKGLKENLENKILKFSYLKDNNTVRELVTTLNKDIICDVYRDFPAFVPKMMYGIDIDSFVIDGLAISTKASRGYIKLPELGSSIYDDTGCRSLNLMRLVSIEEVDKNSVDTTFINVDLSAVLPKFIGALQDTALKMPQLMSKLYKDISGEEPKSAQVPVMLEELSTLINNRDMLLSTSYRRILHCYAIEHIDMLPAYLNEYSSFSTSQSSNNSVGGVTNMGVVVSDDF